jgi:hypothetical protein
MVSVEHRLSYRLEERLLPLTTTNPGIVDSPAIIQLHQLPALTLEALRSSSREELYVRQQEN